MLRRSLFALLLVLSSLATLAQKERHFTSTTHSREKCQPR
jgi:hypothetical protein